MLRRERYDTCFMLKPSKTKALMASMAGIPERISFAGKNASLTQVVEMPKDVLHRADQILALAGILGVEEADGSYEYFLHEEDEDKADDLIHGFCKGFDKTVVFNPGGNWDIKRWPARRFVELGKKILKEYKDVEIMVTGAEKDILLAKGIVHEIRDYRCYQVAGKTGLNVLAAVFKRCSLVISADSGPLHLASAVETPTIGIFCPTSPQLTGPRGKGENIVIIGKTSCNVPCYTEGCKNCIRGMEQIDAEMVFKKVVQILDSKENEEN